jgi:hypothetical protein
MIIVYKCGCRQVGEDVVTRHTQLCKYHRSNPRAARTIDHEATQAVGEMIAKLQEDISLRRLAQECVLDVDPETERAIQWLVWSALVDPAAGPHPAFPHRQEVAR